MPPRYAYWTILIDDKPTAFRAREKAELAPTFHQLQRTNPNIVFKWFARGRLWESPEEARDALRRPRPARERRDREWRPGGQHADPRARFKRRSDKPHAKAGPPRFSDREPSDRQGGRPARPGGARRMSRGKPPRRG